jgi:hypothetical protein
LTRCSAAIPTRKNRHLHHAEYQYSRSVAPWRDCLVIRVPLIKCRSASFHRTCVLSSCLYHCFACLFGRHGVYIGFYMTHGVLEITLLHNVRSQGKLVLLAHHCFGFCLRISLRSLTRKHIIAFWIVRHIGT